MKKSVIFSAALAILTGCAAQNYVMSPETQHPAQPFFVSGMAQVQDVDASAVCQGAHRVAKVETTDSFLNGAMSLMTSGMYMPRQIRVYCT